jgi:hypothetical protein
MWDPSSKHYLPTDALKPFATCTPLKLSLSFFCCDFLRSSCPPCLTENLEHRSCHTIWHPLVSITIIYPDSPGFSSQNVCDAGRRQRAQGTHLVPSHQECAEDGSRRAQEPSKDISLMPWPMWENQPNNKKCDGSRKNDGKENP